MVRVAHRVVLHGAFLLPDALTLFHLAFGASQPQERYTMRQGQRQGGRMTTWQGLRVRVAAAKAAQRQAAAQVAGGWRVAAGSLSLAASSLRHGASCHRCPGDNPHARRPPVLPLPFPGPPPPQTSSGPRDPPAPTVAARDGRQCLRGPPPLLT